MLTYWVATIIVKVVFKLLTNENILCLLSGRILRVKNNLVLNLLSNSIIVHNNIPLIKRRQVVFQMFLSPVFIVDCCLASFGKCWLGIIKRVINLNSAFQILTNSILTRTFQIRISGILSNLFLSFLSFL